MLSYILRRLLLMIPTLLGMTILLFVIVRFAPGVSSGAAFMAASGNMQDDAVREALVLKNMQRLGLKDAQGRDVPVWKQYFIWMGNTFRFGPVEIGGTRVWLPHLDLGESVKYRNKRVSELIVERLPATLSLNIVSFIIVYIIAIPAGMLAAAKRGQMFDVGWSVSSLAFYSIPVVLVGSLLIGYLANVDYLRWFPSGGLHATDTRMMTFTEYVLDYIWHLVLPVICLSYGNFAYLSKQMRGAMLDNLTQDYARTARAKGLSNFTTATRHVFRNSLLPLITLAAGIIPGMIGGSVITEFLFSIKGMGQLAFEAAMTKDLPVIQALGLVGAILTLFSYLIVDICYTIADPRIHFD